METKKNYTEVLIDSKVYVLGGNEETGYLQKIASYVNHKLKELRSQTGFSKQEEDYQQIMLEINMADDYFKAQETADTLRQQKEEIERDIYGLKHDLINAQLKLERAQQKIEELESALSAAVNLANNSSTAKDIAPITEFPKTPKTEAQPAIYQENDGQLILSESSSVPAGWSTITIEDMDDDDDVEVPPAEPQSEIDADPDLEMTGELPSNISEFPAGTQTSMTAEASNTTEFPIITETPNTTELPVITETPKTTEFPIITETPKTTEFPVITEAPNAGESPVLTEESMKEEPLPASQYTEEASGNGVETELSETEEVIIEKLEPSEKDAAEIAEEDFLDDFSDLTPDSQEELAELIESLSGVVIDEVKEKEEKEELEEKEEKEQEKEEEPGSEAMAAAALTEDNHTEELPETSDTEKKSPEETFVEDKLSGETLTTENLTEEKTFKENSAEEVTEEMRQAKAEEEKKKAEEEKKKALEAARVAAARLMESRAQQNWRRPLKK